MADLTVGDGAEEALMFALLFATAIYHFLTLYTSEVSEQKYSEELFDKWKRRIEKRVHVALGLFIAGFIWLMIFVRLRDDLIAVLGAVAICIGLHLFKSNPCPKCGKINGDKDLTCGKCDFDARLGWHKWE